MSPVVSALGICLGGVLLEGVCAGGGIKNRMSALKWPRYSPPLWGWILIGVAYYAIVFVCAWRLLQSASAAPLRNAALSLLLTLVFFNAIWNLLFFRMRNLGATFYFSIVYSIIAVVLGICLERIDRLAAAMLDIYLTYLLYANVWSYRVWQLNRTRS